MNDFYKKHGIANVLVNDLYGSAVIVFTSGESLAIMPKLTSPQIQTGNEEVTKKFLEDIPPSPKVSQKYE